MSEDNKAQEGTNPKIEVQLKKRGRKPGQKDQHPRDCKSRRRLKRQAQKRAREEKKRLAQGLPPLIDDVTWEEVLAFITRLYEEKGSDACLRLLSHFGVKQLSKVPQACYPDLIRIGRSYLEGTNGS